MTSERILQAQGLKKHFPVTEGMLWTKVVGWVKAVDGISRHTLYGSGDVDAGVGGRYDAGHDHV